MKILHGDSLDVLKTLADNSVDSVVTDPPWAIKFMSRHWDYQIPTVELWREVLRVLKPGGHALVCCGTRTQHRMTVAVEDAGFEIRDVITHHYGSGFPKSQDISKAIDKAAGAEREVVGEYKRFDGKPAGLVKKMNGGALLDKKDREGEINVITAPSTDDAKKWAGWGTALKPATEFWTLARKPLEAKLTVAQNVLKYGTGGLNIDASRIAASGPDTNARKNKGGATAIFGNASDEYGEWNQSQGRFPANVLFSEEAASELDRQSGKIKTKLPFKKLKEADRGMYGAGVNAAGQKYESQKGLGITLDGASRFFYVAKASKRERNAGLDSTERIAIDAGCREENTVAVQLLQKVTSESMVKWNIAECGNRITAIFPKECRSTIETELKTITESKTLNSLMHSLTSENTLDVLSEADTGSSLAENVAKLKVWLLSITNGSMELALGASRVASETLPKISASDVTYLNNFHSTVKPIKLMQYLITLITPPGGTVLDPFLGSGSTLVAAKSLGFDGIGIEREIEYVAIAEARIANS